MTTIRAIVLATGAVIAALPAYAQPASPGTGGPQEGGMGQGGMMGGTGMMPMMRMMRMMGPGAGIEHLEGRLAFVKTELKISDAQVPQWNAFADSIRVNAKSMTEMHQSVMSGGAAGKTLPERLALEQKALSAHLDALNKIAAALNALYDALSPEQKKIADEIIIGPMGMPMGMM
jgi:hypothetical protein